MASWRVVWVDRHETEIPTDGDLEQQRSQVWAHLKQLGVHKDQICAFHQQET